MQLQSDFCCRFYWCSCGYGEMSSFMLSCTVEDGAVNRLLLVEKSHQTKSDRLANKAPTILNPGKEAQFFQK